MCYLYALYYNYKEDRMQTSNPLYKRQGIHAIASIFTVEDGVTKVLLVKRKNVPFKDMWALVGGAVYNNEDLLDGLKREIFENKIPRPFFPLRFPPPRCNFCPDML